MGVVALRTEDLTALGGEPRIFDLLLGQTLGFDRPQNVRKVIRRHAKELATHGDLLNQRVRTASGAGAGRPEEGYYLNEAQALLVCMFARTNEAAAARKQLVDVFLAYRHGKLVPTARTKAAPSRDLPWAKMEQRIKRLERMLEMQAKVETEAFASAVAYAPTILYLDGANGKRKKQTRPRWWYDREVREAVIASHRQMTIDIAVASLAAQFGKDRGPSRSSLGRFWLVLDEVRSAS